MQHFRNIILITLLIIASSASAKILISYEQLPFKDSLTKKLSKGHHIVSSEVDSLPNNKQEFHFKMAGLHTKSCNIALRKLSRYETFHKYIEFIDRSSYDDKRKKVYFRIKSPILPYTMVLQFKFDRVSKPGRYPFEFNYGFLKGLKGSMHITEYKNRCLFYTQADWKGPDSKIPDVVFEFFTKALSKMLMEKLFSISRF